MRKDLHDGEMSVIASAVRRNVRPVSNANDTGWFPKICKQLCASNAGMQLAFYSGAEERTCYRYAAGETHPPAHFLRTLLRSEHGEPFFRALMDGCEAPWWIDHQRRLRNGERVDVAAFEGR